LAEPAITEQLSIWFSLFFAPEEGTVVAGLSN